MDRQPIITTAAPQAIGPYSQAITAGGFVFCSGQLGVAPETGALVPGGIEAETEQALRNLSAVLKAAGSSLERVVKTTVYLTDMGAFAAMNTVYGRHFKDPAPARATIQVAALPRGGCVEIEATAIRQP